MRKILVLPFLSRKLFYTGAMYSKLDIVGGLEPSHSCSFICLTDGSVRLENIVNEVYMGFPVKTRRQAIRYGAFVLWLFFRTRLNGILFIAPTYINVEYRLGLLLKRLFGVRLYVYLIGTYWYGQMSSSYKRMLNNADLIMVCSDYYLNYLTNNGIKNQKVEKIPFFVNKKRSLLSVEKEPARRKLGFHLDAPIVLHVGIWDEFDTNIIRKLMEGYNRLFVVLVSFHPRDYVDEEKKQSLIRLSHEFQDRLKIFEDVPYEDVPMFYRACDVHICTTVKDNFGNPLREALCNGMPVVTYEAGIDVEWKGEGLLAVKTGDSEKFCQTVLELIDDKPRLNELRQKALRFAATGLDYETFVQRLMTQIWSY